MNMSGNGMEYFAPMLAGFAILGTVLGVVLRGWSSIRGWLQRCMGYLFVHAHLDDEVTIKAVLAYLMATYPRNKSGEKTFGGRCDSFRDGKYGHIPFELLGNRSLLFWKGWIPFWFSVQAVKEDPKGAGGNVIYWGSKPKETSKASVVFLRRTLDVDEIIKQASRSRNQTHWSVNDSKNKRFFVKKIPDPKQEGLQRYSAGTSLEWFHEGNYRLLDHDPSELGKAALAKDGCAADKLFFPPHVKNLIEEVRTWHGLKEWYQERYIPWKRGWCLYGPPGTGKTALVRAIAEDLDMPLFVYSLGQMLDVDLERSWVEMQAHTPCVALFEDFDTVFHGRQNVYGKPTIADQIAGAAMQKDATVSPDGGLKGGQLSFGCLLNCIDGVEKSGGIFVVFTTNAVDKFDPALGQPRKNSDGTVDFISTRPGRIDKAIELGYMDNPDKLLLARRIFFDNDHGYEIMVESVEREPDKKETPAQFQERCAQLALEMLWKTRAAAAREIPSMPSPHVNGKAEELIFN